MGDLVAARALLKAALDVRDADGIHDGEPVLKARSEAPFCAIMKSAPPIRIRSLAVAFSPPVIAPRATTAVIPRPIPSTVSAVRTRCRTRFLTMSVENLVRLGSRRYSYLSASAG